MLNIRNAALRASASWNGFSSRKEWLSWSIHSQGLISISDFWGTRVFVLHLSAYNVYVLVYSAASRPHRNHSPVRPRAATNSSIPPRFTFFFTLKHDKKIVKPGSLISSRCSCIKNVWFFFCVNDRVWPSRPRRLEEPREESGGGPPSWLEAGRWTGAPGAVTSHWPLAPSQEEPIQDTEARLSLSTPDVSKGQPARWCGFTGYIVSSLIFLWGKTASPTHSNITKIFMRLGKKVNTYIKIHGAHERAGKKGNGIKFID